MVWKQKMQRVFILLAAFVGMLVLTAPAKVLADKTYKAVSEGGAWYLEEAGTGKKVTGLKGMQEFPAGSGKWYWFQDTTGKICRKTWIRSGSKTYRAQNNGTLAAGRVRVGGKYYYFSVKTHVMSVNAWRKVNGGYCRFGSKGAQLFGLTTVNRFTYYFDPEDGGIRAVGLQKISGKTYYFNEKGRMQKGFVKLDGKTCFFSASGEMVTGWMTQGDKKYYFDPKTGAMATGKVTIDGKTYDFGSKGYINADPSSLPGAWSIRVNKSTNVVTIYKGDTAVKAMLCSVGLNDATPSGTFSLGGPLANWHPLFGNVWGQYCRTITGNILFHSVYYLGYRNVHTLATGEYVKLGQAASHGCVRLSAGDAYYIWTKIPTGTSVKIGYFGNTDPLQRPALTPLNGKDYDPTDPNLND